MKEYFNIDLKEIKSEIKSLEHKLGYIPKPQLSTATAMYSGCGSGGCVASCSGGCAGGAYDSCFFA